MKTSVPMIVLCFMTTAVDAQWLNQPTPGIPRTPDGKPNLTAPAPRTPEGRPDMSGAFGCGQLSRQEFGERFVRDWGIDLAPERFLEEFRSWSTCLLPGAVELLASLRSRFRLAALSNSNELHWERNSRDLGITNLFEVAISSHQVGLRKPDPRIYLAALDRLGVSPDGTMFFDDVHDNVVAAAALGIRAFQVDGVQGVRERLIRDHLL